jgi:Prokaryotic metallothionein
MSETIERVKCACSDCVCVVDVKKGVHRDGR